MLGLPNRVYHERGPIIQSSITCRAELVKHRLGFARVSMPLEDASLSITDCAANQSNLTQHEFGYSV